MLQSRNCPPRWAVARISTRDARYAHCIDSAHLAAGAAARDPAAATVREGA
jgi:hypothetical protein